VRFGKAQRATLSAIKPVIAPSIGGALDRFYSGARAAPDTAALLRDEAHVRKAKAAQETHWLRIASGGFDE
jgi:hypothetical protein